MELNHQDQAEVVTLRSGKQLLEREKPTEKEAIENQKKKLDGESTQPVKEYKPTIPYIAKFKNDHLDEQFGKFLELFKTSH